MYIDPISRPTFNFATPISCDNNPNNVIALDPDTDEHYVPTHKPVLRATPMLFKPKHFQHAISPNTRSWNIIQYWNKEFFESCFFFAKHSHITLKFLEKAFSYDCLATSEQHPTCFGSPPNRNRFYPYNVLRVGLHFSNIAALFAPDWFADAFIALLGFPCYVLTQCRIYFSNFLFVKNAFPVLVKLQKSISIKFRLLQLITIMSSPTQAFNNYTTSKRSLIYMTLNMTNVNGKQINVLMTLLNILQKTVAGTYKSYL